MESTRKAVPILAAAALVVTSLVGGVVLGAWFTSHYRIVPIGQGQSMAAVPPAAVSTSSGGPAESLASLPESIPNPPKGETAQFSPAKSKGPFAFKFTPGEALNYRIQAQVGGKGFESIGPGDVKLGIASDFTLKTDDVDRNGAADMTLTYNTMLASGDFMGSDYALDYRRGRTAIKMNGNTTVDTARGIGSTKGIQQIEFLQDPVRMRIASNGQVINVKGGAGWADMIREVPGVVPVEFPDTELRDGLQWDSNFTFPLPGAGEPIKAKMHNIVIGYQYVGDRYCAVIQQDFDSRQNDGTIGMPKSSMGDAANFTMPLFELRGRNYIYFDVQRGQLVHAKNDLKLTMKIGKMLGKAFDGIKTATDAISQILGNGSGKGPDLSEILGDGKSKEDGLDLALDINSTMTLNDPSVPAMVAQRAVTSVHH